MGLDDFRVHLRQVWDFLEIPDIHNPGHTAVPTPVQNDIAKYLQHAPKKRIIISAFRGVGKSYITAAFVTWLLLQNPDLKIMVVSANGDYASEISKFIKKLINGISYLGHLKPKEDEDRVDLWTVGAAKDAKDSSVKSVGINGQLTGSRADIIIFDDVEVPKNSQTHHAREQLARLVTEASDVLTPLPHSRIIYLGTPQVEDSLYMKLLSRGYEMRVWPSEIPEKPENYGGSIDSATNRLADYVKKRIKAGWPPGTPIDPKRFSKDDLQERKVEKGLSGYALQFLLDVNPASGEKRPLKLYDLLVTDVDPDQGHIKLVWSKDRECRIEGLTAGGMDGDYYVRPAYKSPEMEKWGGTVMAIDPSGKGKDETAYAIMRYLHGYLALVEVGGFLDGYGDETLEALARRAAYHKVNWWVAEENYGGGMFTNLLKPWMAREYEVPGGGKRTGGSFDAKFNGWSHGTKEFRILDTLEPVVSSHRLIVDRKVIEQDIQQQMEKESYSFVWQFTRMERMKGALSHDDRLEAVAMAASYWTEKMDRDADRVVNMRREQARDDELRKFVREARGLGYKKVGRPAGGGRSRWCSRR